MIFGIAALPLGVTLLGLVSKSAYAAAVTDTDTPAYWSLCTKISTPAAYSYVIGHGPDSTILPPQLELRL
jgi:hypothetical protein